VLRKCVNPFESVGPACAAATHTGARLSCAECEMSAAVDVFGLIIGGRSLYAAETAEIGCFVCGRVPTGPFRFARPVATPIAARPSCAECEMSAAVDVFGHSIGGRFLYAAATAEVWCLVSA